MVNKLRVLRRPDFLKLPAGTVYAKGKEWYFGSLSFKGESLGDRDWYAHDPCWVDAQDSGEAFNRLEEMLETGASYPMESAEARDGLFEQDDIFLVFERDDLLALHGLIGDAIALTDGEIK